VRVYDGRTGILIKVFSDFMMKQRASDIANFCMDDRHRRFYLGNTAGEVKAFNASSGLPIKSFGEEVLKGCEVSDMVFAEGDQLLITALTSVGINVYDEGKFDSIARLRQITGGHLGSEIKALGFSRHLSLIASGAANGSITVWDYEMSRIEGVCLFHKREILALKFLDPYPTLISSAADDYICIWSVRGDEVSRRYSCLSRFVNLQNATSFAVQCLFPFVLNHKQIHRKSVSSLSEKELKQNYNNLLDKEEKTSKQERVFFDNKKLVDTFPDKEVLRSFMITGDERGRIRIWSLSQVLAYYSVKTVPNYTIQNEYYNPKRNEDANATLQAKMIYHK
jgi:WD40 repeat protein